MSDLDGGNNQNNLKPQGNKKNKLTGIVALASVLALAIGGIITLAINNNASISADVALVGSGNMTGIPTMIQTTTPWQTMTRPVFTQTSTPITPTPTVTQTSRVDACRAACAGQGKTCNESNFTCYSGLSTPSPVATTSNEATDSAAIQQCNNASFPATASHPGKQCQWKYTNQTMTSGYCSCSEVDEDGNVTGDPWTAAISVTPTSSKTTTTSSVALSPTASRTPTSPTPVATKTDVYDQVAQCQNYSYNATAEHKGKTCSWQYTNPNSPVGGKCVCRYVDSNGNTVGNSWTAGTNTAPGLKGAVITAYQSVANFFASLWARIF